MKKIVLFGAGGYSDNIRMILGVEYDVVGYLDEGRTGEYHGLPILGAKVEDVPGFRQYCYFVCIGDIEARKRIFCTLKQMNLEIVNVIAKEAYVSPDLKIGVGNYVAPGAKLMADVVIADNNYIGTSAIVEHGSRVGSHCRISSNATLNGETIVGDEVFFGSGAISNECVSIGEMSVVGSGSVVIENVPPEVTVVGVPANIIKRAKKDRLVIFGAGQQGRNCKRLAEELLMEVVGFVDDYEADIVEGVKVYRQVDQIPDFRSLKYIVGVGNVDDRRAFIDVIDEFGLECVNLIDPTAVIEKGAQIGVGNYIYKLATVYASAKIGNHNIINTGSVIATDAVIGDNCNIYFGANVCGDCHIGDNAVVGHCATVYSGFNVGPWAHVEGSSMVYRDVDVKEYVHGFIGEKGVR